MMFRKLSEDDVSVVRRYLEQFGSVEKTVDQIGFLASTFPLGLDLSDFDGDFKELEEQKEIDQKLVLKLDFMLAAVPDNINISYQENLKEIVVKLKRIYFTTHRQSVYD